METRLILVCSLILLAFSCSSAPTVKEGAKLFNEQKYTEAIQVFEKVLEKDPKNANALYNIAISYIQLKDDDKALIYLNKTVEVNPFYEDAWYNIAYLLYKKGDFKGAVEAGYNGGTDALNILRNSIAKLKEQGIEIPADTIQPIIIGALDRSTIDSNIEKYSKDYKKCYETALAKNSDLEGRTIVNFVIRGEGKVASAKINRTSLNDEALNLCILDITKKIVFPVPKGGGIVIVNYPFVFRPVRK